MLHLSFARADSDVRRILRRRFGPNLVVYGSSHEWENVPGPP
jgi:hypothetical protein